MDKVPMHDLAGGKPVPKSSLSADAKEFIPSQRLYVQNITESTGDPSSIVADAVLVLQSNPETFYEVANHLLSSLAYTFADDSSISNVVETIYTASVSEDNFRYSGVRLLAFLCERLPEDVRHQFRTILLKRCHVEYDRRDELMTSDVNYLIRFTLFMSELMCNLLVNELPSRVLDLLTCLLIARSEDCIKGLVRSLKLVGALLETHEKEKLSDLISGIKKLTADDNSSETQRLLLVSILELRASHWLAAGDTSLSAAVNTTDTASAPMPAKSDTDNVVIEYFSDDDDDDFINKEFDIVYDGDVGYAVAREMDPDMEAEYEKFVAENETRLMNSSKSGSS